MSSVIVLAFGAHPDDIALFMSGTLYKLGKLGIETHAVVATAGEGGVIGADRSAVAQRRVAEARAEAQVWGAASFTYIGENAPSIQDGQLHDDDVLRKAIVHAIRRIWNGRVGTRVLLLCPPSNDYHPDHQALSNAVSAAQILCTANYGDGQPLDQWPMVACHDARWPRAGATHHHRHHRRDRR